VYWCAAGGYGLYEPVAVLGPGPCALGCTVGGGADVLVGTAAATVTGSGVVYVGGNVGVIDECEYEPY
jgi:hypothetical protein